MCKIDQEMDLFNSSFLSSVQSHIRDSVRKTDKKSTKKNEYKNRRESQTAQCLDTAPCRERLVLLTVQNFIDIRRWGREDHFFLGGGGGGGGGGETHPNNDVSLNHRH